MLPGEEDIGRRHRKHKCGRRKCVLIGHCGIQWAGWAKENRVLGKEVVPALRQGPFKPFLRIWTINIDKM